MSTIILVSGGFDPVHKGHVRMFKEAKKLGSMLLVAVNSNEWVKKKKGYVFMDWLERTEIIEEFECVDGVFHFQDDDEGTANNAIRRIRQIYPDDGIIFANGGDRGEGNVPEIGVCEELEVEMRWNVGGHKIQSSSELVKKGKENKKKK